MNKNDADLPPHQALLLDEINALKAHNAREERRRKGENEKAWPIRTWVISDGTAGMLAQCQALTKAMRIQAEDGIRDTQTSRGLGDVYKRQGLYYVF